MMTNRHPDRRRRRRSGHAVVEAALLAPWIFFLFVGVLDFGFYAYAAIATENAARVAAMQTSGTPATASNSALACQYVLDELNELPNVRQMFPRSCASSPGAVSSAAPVAVVAQLVTGADGQPATRVSVTYLTLRMIPIPGVMMMQYNITRIVEMRVVEA